MNTHTDALVMTPEEAAGLMKDPNALLALINYHHCRSAEDSAVSDDTTPYELTYHAQRIERLKERARSIIAEDFDVWPIELLREFGLEQHATHVGGSDASIDLEALRIDEPTPLPQVDASLLRVPEPRLATASTPLKPTMTQAQVANHFSAFLIGAGFIRPGDSMVVTYGAEDVARVQNFLDPFGIGKVGRLGSVLVSIIGREDDGRLMFATANGLAIHRHMREDVAKHWEEMTPEQWGQALSFPVTKAPAELPTGWSVRAHPEIKNAVQWVLPEKHRSFWVMPSDTNTITERAMLDLAHDVLRGRQSS